MFLLKRLPLAFFAGVRVKTFNNKTCSTRLKFKWINQNPFKSMYFAAMQMAAELSTGLILFRFKDEGVNYSMLLVSVKANYFKKAVGVITFKCNQVTESEEFIDLVLSSSEGVSKVFKVDAYNKEQIKVAEFEFEWSCKKK